MMFIFKRIYPVFVNIEIMLKPPVFDVCKGYRTYSAVKLFHKVYDAKNTKHEETFPLVILHGLFGSSRNWHTLAKSINSIGNIPVITVDVRNHGDSPHTLDMDYHAMSADVEQLILDIGFSKVDLLGHSMGGKIAMSLSLKHPDLVHKLIVEDVSPSSSEQLSDTPKYIESLRSVQFDNSLHIVDAKRHVSQQLCDVIQDKFIRNFILTNVTKDGDNLRWKFNLEAIRNHFNDIMGFPEFQSLFPGESLFIGGELSNYIRQEDEEKIKSLFPRAQIVEIRKAGHWVHSDTPQEFLQTLLTFLKGCSGESRI